MHIATICPGFTDTEMLGKTLQGDPEITAAVAGRSGLNRLIEPAEIARLLYFAAHNPVVRPDRVLSLPAAGLGEVR